MLDVCLPGTGGMMPLPERWLSCCWIEYQGRALLIDCGEGTQIALAKAGLKLSHLELLLITHFHADHIAGLPGLLLTLGNNGRQSPLTIIGPHGLKAVFSSLTVIAPLSYQVELIEIKNEAAGYLEDDDIRIDYLPLAHRIMCLGYRVSLKRKPIFNPEKAALLDIPKNQYKRLHAGEALKLEDGRVITPDMVLDGERPPLSVCYMTDSTPTDAMPSFAHSADLLVCEGMYGDDDMRDKMLEKGHMLFSDSARIAHKAGVKKLWLTHYSPALKDPQEYQESIQAVFPNAVLGYDGIKTTLR